jgi:crossover junction endodeoxyribonuclease RuvC
MTPSVLRVLGIDPGTRALGWGVVERNGTRLVHVAHGVIRASGDLPLAERLVIIERELVDVVGKYSVHSASIEAMFFHKDAQAAAKLGHARGVAMLVCARAGLQIFEYAPTRVKRAVAGTGRAEKSQVAMMVRALLKLVELPPSDAADALAISITHLQRAPLDARVALRPLPPPARTPLRGPLNPLRTKRVKLA